VAKKTATKTQIVRVPMTKPPQGMRLVPRGALAAGRVGKVGKAAKKHYRRAAAFAGRHSPVLMPLLGAGALGIAERMFPDMPKVEILGTSGTYGLGLFLVGHFANMPVVKALSLGPLCVAVHQIGKSGELGVTGLPGTPVEGFQFGD
jgi:hypothetical protein